MAMAEAPAPEAQDIRDIPLERLDPARSDRFPRQAHWALFDRLRAEDPVHYTPESDFGPYWSITRYDDIMAVDTNHRAFSSAQGIFIGDRPEDFVLPNFISADEPRHSQWRKPVMPAVGAQRLDALEELVRERVGRILDDLPRNEAFDWVDRVSIELTTQLLATLFDFPFEERRKLTFWSDMTVSSPLVGAQVMPEEERRAHLMECAEAFGQLLKERRGGEGWDLVTLMANSPDMAELHEDPMKLLGNVLLLIVGGNDTTRNSISGGVLAMHDNPDQWAKAKADPSRVKGMVSEIIRWQTPLAYMRRTALADTEVGGKTIREGDKLAMWYVSGNRDERKFEDPYRFDIARRNARSHLAFGFGVHRCMGNHVAEMQLRLLWEEILRRFDRIEVVGEPERVTSNFVMGFSRLPVRIPG
jgi:cytochrome P450